MSYSLKRKKTFASKSVQEFEFSSSEEDFEQNYIRNTDIDELPSVDGIEHSGEKIINNNIENVHRRDLSFNSSLIGNLTQPNKSFAQSMSIANVTNQSNPRINDSSLQTSLLNSNLSIIKNETKEEAGVNTNSDKILDDLKFVKGRGQLLNKKHPALLKNRKNRCVVNKKRKVVDSGDSENSEDNDLHNIGESFELNTSNKVHKQDHIDNNKTVPGNSHKYKSQKAALTEIMDQNQNTKDLDHRQREIVLYSLAQAKDELLLKSSQSENTSEEESAEETMELSNKRKIDFMQYKESFDGFVYSDDMPSNVAEFVKLLKEDAEFLSFVEVYEKTAIEEYINKVRVVLETDDEDLKFLLNTFILVV